jgi:hypothetical protein
VIVLLTLSLLAGNPSDVPDGGAVPADPKDIAVSFARGLLAGDADALTKLTPPGFAFDGRVVWNAADVRSEWLHALEQRPLAGVQIYGVDVLPYDEMLKRYGKPPARLSQMNLAGTRIAVVDLGGRALLVIFKKKGDGWAAIGVSD